MKIYLCLTLALANLHSQNCPDISLQVPISLIHPMSKGDVEKTKDLMKDLFITSGSPHHIKGEIQREKVYNAILEHAKCIKQPKIVEAIESYKDEI